MDFVYLLRLTLSGLSMGVIYALIGMGLILLIKAIGVLNYAQGDILALGAFAALGFSVRMELPLWAAVVCSLMVFIVFALFFMFCIYWPLRQTTFPVTIMIATLGASIVIKEGLMLIFGANPKPVPAFLVDEAGNGLTFRIFGVTMQWQYVVILVFGIVIIAGIFLLFEKVYAGKIMQAASQDKYAADLIGIPTVVTIAVTFIISICVAAFSGFMIAPLYSASITLNDLQFAAFAGVVIGGWGNIKGAVIGSLIVGLVQAYAYPIFNLYKDCAVFSLMILFLLFRPTGIFKSPIGDKA